VSAPGTLLPIDDHHLQRLATQTYAMLRYPSRPTPVDGTSTDLLFVPRDGGNTWAPPEVLRKLECTERPSAACILETGGRAAFPFLLAGLSFREFDRCFRSETFPPPPFFFYTRNSFFNPVMVPGGRGPPLISSPVGLPTPPYPGAHETLRLPPGIPCTR